MRQENETPYAVGSELRIGRYPGRVLAVFATHWEAVKAMLAWRV